MGATEREVRVELFVEGRLNPQAFETSLRQGTRDLHEIAQAAARTQSARIESTHVLMALGKIPKGITQRELSSRFGLSPQDWDSGLSGCVERRGGIPPAHVLSEAFEPNAIALLDAARDIAERRRDPRISEAVLLAAALGHMTSAVRDLCRKADIDVEAWRAAIEREYLTEIVPVTIYDEQGSVRLPVFSASARKVLRRMHSEAESLGCQIVDPRHLLLGLLAHGGVTASGLYRQGIAPRKVHEAVMLSLRPRASQQRKTVPMTRAHHQAMLQKILERAGEMAARTEVQVVGEAECLRAFLDVDHAALNFLDDYQVDRTKLRASAELFEDQDDEPTDTMEIADIDSVRKRLEACLVGQTAAIDQIVPYVQRMRFGFMTPGRPVGVFLFCGQSGSGKTEMAKELARAVYGSEEHLVFLEMGQFNTRESMSIFVGAPPGYVGYGEGKLTNGLRDKPRSVVLFDEVEKAHSKVLDALLRFIDEGKIDDPAGPLRDGSQCIVVLTSNLGADELSRLSSEIYGSAAAPTDVRQRLRAAFGAHRFRPEFLNRVDEIVLFRTLATGDYREIADRLLARDTERLRRERGVDVTIDPYVAEAIGRYCYTLNEGARATQRLTQLVVITPVIDFLVNRGCTPPVALHVTLSPHQGHRAGEPVGIVSFAHSRTGGYA
jgi:ATP-dependent Clp protease ATP-binding subunit ClpA